MNTRPGTSGIHSSMAMYIIKMLLNGIGDRATRARYRKTHLSTTFGALSLHFHSLLIFRLSCYVVLFFLHTLGIIHVIPNFRLIKRAYFMDRSSERGGGRSSFFSVESTVKCPSSASLEYLTNESGPTIPLFKFCPMSWQDEHMSRVALTYTSDLSQKKLSSPSGTKTVGNVYCRIRKSTVKLEYAEKPLL